jgi:tRNA A-37 threonylcarbamoyl transferase component Bud32
MIKQKTKATTTKRSPKKQKRNPELQKRANNILLELDAENIRYLAEGNYAEVYKFSIEFPTTVQKIKLNPGTYVLKLIKLNETSSLDSKEIKYLQKLSKLGLIPKIYVNTDDFVIMKYIEGDTLLDLIHILPPNELEIVLQNLGDVIQKWHDSGFIHGDLHLKNIMVDQDSNVYLIDPTIYTRSLNEDMFEEDNKMYSFLYNKYSPTFKINKLSNS